MAPVFTLEVCYSNQEELAFHYSVMQRSFEWKIY